MLNKLMNFIINSSVTWAGNMNYFHYVRAVAAVEREDKYTAENGCTASQAA
ncbi:MAG: hypothetical protein H6Q73_3690 [Firmicutes bacterium]|nr:hypothetical protein [Bacillota bacterium]